MVGLTMIRCSGRLVFTCIVGTLIVFSWSSAQGGERTPPTALSSKAVTSAAAMDDSESGSESESDILSRMKAHWSTAFRVAPAPFDTQEFLRQFHANPRRILNSPPAKLDDSGTLLTMSQKNLFSGDTESVEFLIYRDEIRRQICMKTGMECDAADSGQHTFGQFGDHDQIDFFVFNQPILRKPVEMETMQLTQMTLEQSPWSDSFWPVHKGLIARRYADPGYPTSKKWQENYDYIIAHPASTIATDMMAPAEKYDYFVGDSAWRLTTRMWKKGLYYIAMYGFVPSWTGLCHGWSPASFMIPRPTRSITVAAFNGGSVTFHPSDIKALGAQLWGEAPPIVKFVGKRCKKFNPQEDEVGRVTTDACFDVNPGTFHMAMVNQLGVTKRSFVMDSTFDFEVWNYPIYAYQYHYFNPQTLAVSKRLAGNVIRIEDFAIDKFQKYRNPQTKRILGVVMDVTYAIPMQPSHRVMMKDRYHTVRYVYDLELDASSEIIGGEWYSNFHPDFLWSPPPDSRAMAQAEKGQTLFWNGEGPISVDIQAAALRASPKGEPLAAIVETLAALASGQTPHLPTTPPEGSSPGDFEPEQPDVSGEEDLGLGASSLVSRLRSNKKHLFLAR